MSGRSFDRVPPNQRRGRQPLRRGNPPDDEEVESRPPPWYHASPDGPRPNLGWSPDPPPRNSAFEYGPHYDDGDHGANDSDRDSPSPPPPPRSSNLGPGRQRLGDNPASWNDIFSQNQGRMPTREPSPPSPPQRRSPPSASSTDSRRVTMILNGVPMTQNAVDNIVELFWQRRSCYEIMRIAAQIVHGRPFEPGLFDPECVIASLCAKGVFQTANDDGRQYDFFAEDDLEQAAGIGRGTLQYRTTGNQNGVPNLEMRLRRLDGMASRGFFIGFAHGMGIE